tara:strand:- start:158 stop:673 length:516 start_codon:yes stop_codon:yes gene_type:complete
MIIHKNLNLLPKNLIIFYISLLTLIACESPIKKNPLAKMEERKNLSHIRTPDIIKDRIKPDNTVIGQKVYNQYCLACHQSNGMGASGRFPPLKGTEWVTGDKKRLVHLILNGMEGEIEVNGEIYNGLMPQHSFLNDDQIAEVLTYIRTNFNNKASSLSAEEVKRYRKTNIK